MTSIKCILLGDKNMVTVQFNKKTGKDRRFCSGDFNSEKQKLVRLWFTKNKRTLCFLLRFKFTHWILHLLQPLQSWAVKSQRRFFRCIKARGDFCRCHSLLHAI